MIVLRRVPLGSELVRLGDVAALRRLVASAEQEQHAVAALCVVDPGTGSLGQPKFQDALTDRLDVAAAAVGEAVDPGQDPQASLSVLQLAQPPVEVVGADVRSGLSSAT